MKDIEVSVLVHPKKEIQAVCRNCGKVVHSATWGTYADYKAKRKKFDEYTTCPYCKKENK